MVAPKRASIEQIGISVETDKTWGHDGEPRTREVVTVYQRKVRAKNIWELIWKILWRRQCFVRPLQDDSSDEEGEIDDYTYKSSLSRTREPKEADSDDELDA